MVLPGAKGADAVLKAMDQAAKASMKALGSFRKQQFLYLRPDLQWQSSLRPTFGAGWT